VLTATPSDLSFVLPQLIGVAWIKNTVAKGTHLKFTAGHVLWLLEAKSAMAMNLMRQASLSDH
jgi:hypothetical protein